MKKIIDVCCGSRMFWFDKNNPLVIFNDIRDEEHVLCDGRTLKIHPDTKHDFTDLKFPDKQFKLVVFDPPHFLKLGENSWMAKKYGRLNKNWQEDIRDGFKECWRILDDDGVLIFKWSPVDISLSEIIALFDIKPLFGHTTRQKNQCTWFCYMKQKVSK
jgi:hypothetical protein